MKESHALDYDFSIWLIPPKKKGRKTELSFSSDPKLIAWFMENATNPDLFQNFKIKNNRESDQNFNRIESERELIEGGTFSSRLLSRESGVRWA